MFRRYSRFREMHKTLKLKYPEVSFGKTFAENGRGRDLKMFVCLFLKLYA